MAIYTIGDIHGQLDMLTKLIAKLDLQPDDHLIFLGDYIDRGPDWLGVIKYIKELSKKYKVTTLVGNHELMMEISLVIMADNKLFESDKSANTELILHWAKNGGDVTINSIMDLSLEDYELAVQFIRELDSEITIKIDDRSYTLCHSIPTDIIDSKFDDDNERKWEATWTRITDDNDNLKINANVNINALLENYNNKTIVHGHTPVIKYGNKGPHKYNINNVKFINIDTGCAYVGKYRFANLCALRLDDEKEFYAI